MVLFVSVQSFISMRKNNLQKRSTIALISNYPDDPALKDRKLG